MTVWALDDVWFDHERLEGAEDCLEGFVHQLPTKGAESRTAAIFSAA